MNRQMKWTLCGLLSALCLPLQLMANVAIPQAVSVRQADGKEVQIRVHGDEFFHYTTDMNGYLINQKKDGNYYYSSFAEDGRIRLSSNPYGSLKPVMHREYIPQTVKEKAVQRREEVNARRNGAGLRSAPARSAILTHPTPRQLVLLVEYTDVKFSSATANADFSALLNEKGYFQNGATGSAYDYFYENSLHQFNPTFDVYGPFTTSKAMAEYGGNTEYGSDKNPQEMIVEAVKAAAAGGVDLSRYDLDGDGMLDNVFVFYAGFSESEGGDENTIWPHASNLYYQNISINGIRLGSYACSSELRFFNKTMCGIGTFCHEYAHVLGLWDIYDTDYEENGSANDWGILSLMSSGNYNNNGRTPPYMNAEEREQLGWYKIPTLQASGDYSLLPVSQNEAYRIETDNKNEYFVIEYRKQEKWDSYIGKDGVIIYHVDKSQNMVGDMTAAQLWMYNMVNCFPSHRCMYLVDASNKNAAITADVFYPYDRNKSFNLDSKPASVSWNALPLEVGLYNIAHDGEKATFQAKSENEKAHVGGIVSMYDGSPLSNAVVQLSPIVETRTASGLRMARAAKEEDSYICRSNAQGQYGFYRLPAGKYLLSCQADKYMPVSYELQLETGSTKQNIVMLTEDEQYYHEGFAWYNQEDMPVMSVGTAGSDFVVGTFWTAEDLKEVVGDMFGTTSIRMSSGNPDVTCMIVVDDTTVIAEQTLENVPSGEITFSFRNDSVKIEEGVDYHVAFAISDYPENAYPVMIDNGPAVSGKGDLFYGGQEDGWITLAEASKGSIDGNWIISFVSCIDKPYVPVEELSMSHDSIEMRVGEEMYMATKILPSDATSRTTQWRSSDPSVVMVNNTGLITAQTPGEAYVYVSVDKGQKTDSCKVSVVASLSSAMQLRNSQRQVFLSWDGGVDDAWKLYYSKPSDTQMDSLLLDEPLVCVTGLEPGNMYQFKMYAYQNGVLSDSLQRVVNLPKISNDFPALYMEASYTEGEPCMIDVNNLKAPYEKLLWFIDDEAVQAPLLRSIPAGKHILKVEIHYTADEDVETIVRKFEVKEK